MAGYELPPERESLTLHLRPLESRGSVFDFAQAQPIQHLCHLGDLQRAHATRPERMKSPQAVCPLCYGIACVPRSGQCEQCKP